VRILPLSQASLREVVAGLRPAPEQSRAVGAQVAELLDDVRARGDEAILAATRRLDWPAATLAGLPVPPAELDAALAAVDPDLLGAFAVARANLIWFHEHERRPDWSEVGPNGQLLGIRHRPVGRAGLYVPGGRGSYASTVIMNAVPAQVAGVRGLFICTPPDREGRVNPSVLAAARFMGIDEVYRIGGAQAVAAMAFGTATVGRADVICGPGNAYVTEAKRQVFGRVGIDGLAGPSEVIVVADDGADPTWVAADLLAQEEHGSGATGVLMAESAAFCGRVAEAAAVLRSRGSAVGEPAEPAVEEPAVGEQGAGLTALYPAAGESFLEVALALIEEYAPEHLEVQLSEPGSFMQRVGAAGAIFVGDETPTAFGDYCAGSNHVLPTGGAARFSSPLSVDTFTRKSSVLQLDADTAHFLTPALAAMARSEGFVFHRLSAELRDQG